MMPLLVSDLSSFEAEVHHPKEIHAQLTFLKETMALDVTDGDACGVEAILEMWRLFSLHHSDVSVQLKRSSWSATSRSWQRLRRELPLPITQFALCIRTSWRQKLVVGFHWLGCC